MNILPPDLFVIHQLRFGTFKEVLMARNKIGVPEKEDHWWFGWKVFVAP